MQLGLMVQPFLLREHAAAQNRQVFNTLPKGRDIDIDDVQTVVEI